MYRLLKKKNKELAERNMYLSSRKLEAEKKAASWQEQCIELKNKCEELQSECKYRQEKMNELFYDNRRLIKQLAEEKTGKHCVPCENTSDNEYEKKYNDLKVQFTKLAELTSELFHDYVDRL